VAIATVRLPNQRSLAAVLAPLLESNSQGLSDSPGLTVLHRRRLIDEGSFASEIVRCRRGDGSTVELVCKYTAKLWGPPGAESWGHRRGVLHEGRVYRDVLQPTGLSTPHFFGVGRDRNSGARWLVLEYLEGGVRVNKSADPAAMGLAARWIGRFHALTASHLRRRPLPFLRTFDAAYYRGWVRRTMAFAGRWHDRFPWLRPLGERFEGWAPLLASGRSVIHGEYYGRNVLYRRGTIYPIDWESAAVAAGEIDLAALIEQWPRETVTRCVREYRRARWPKGTPPDFAHRLDAARMFNVFRWLGDEPQMTQQAYMKHYFDDLQTAAVRLHLL